MNWRDVPRSEWAAAALLTAAGSVCASTLHGAADELDRTSERRTAQVAALAEVASATSVAPADVRGLVGLFHGHVVNAGRAPWGSCLDLQSTSPDRP